jgi:hypothetical protein
MTGNLTASRFDKKLCIEYIVTTVLGGILYGDLDCSELIGRRMILDKVMQQVFSIKELNSFSFELLSPSPFSNRNFSLTETSLMRQRGCLSRRRL